MSTIQLATLCYIKKNHQTLMLHRIKKDQDVHLGKWNGLGGKMEPGEVPEECIKREVKEESGLVIADPCLRGILSFPLFTPKKDWIVFLFDCNSFSGSLKESQEGHLKWIENSKISELNLWEGDKNFLKWIEQPHFFTAEFRYINKKLVESRVKFNEIT